MAFRVVAVSRVFKEKLAKVRALLNKKRKAAALITSQANFSWLGCGGEARVAVSTEQASAAWLVKKDEVYLVANGIEVPRLQSEVLNALKFETLEFDWHNPKGLLERIQEVADPKRILADRHDCVKSPQSAAFAELRYSLCSEEVKRFRFLGKALEASIAATAHGIRVGETENEIAAQMTAASIAVGLTPVVVLVAVDERIRRFRHPLPTNKKLKRHAMLIMCARYQGLIASMTRTVDFGDVPPLLRKKHQAACTVDVTLQQATRVGVAAGRILKEGLRVYADLGFGDEWKAHHQGGPCGYLPREYIVTPEMKTKVEASQPFTWNPTVAGTKSEDTVLVTPRGPEVITKSADWPKTEVVLDKKRFNRYAILDR